MVRHGRRFDDLGWFEDGELDDELAGLRDPFEEPPDERWDPGEIVAEADWDQESDRDRRTRRRNRERRQTPWD